MPRTDRRRPRVRTVFLVGVLAPLLVSAALGGLLVRGRLLDRSASTRVVEHTQTLRELAGLRAAIADEETQSTTIVIAQRYGLVEAGWFDVEAARPALAAARGAVDALVADRSVDDLVALADLRQAVDAGVVDYAAAVDRFDAVAGALTSAWDTELAAIADGADGRPQPADVRARLRALRNTIDAFALGMPRARLTVELYLGTATDARAFEMVEVSSRFWDASDAARQDGGEAGAEAWRRFVEDPGVARMEAHFELAPMVGLGLAAPQDLADPERWRQSIEDGGTFSSLLADAVLATARDLEAVARAHVEADAAAVRLSSVLAAVVVAISLGAALAAARRLTRPVRDLEAAARRVERGDFHGTAVRPRGPRELSAALEAFNDMTATLAAIEDHAVSLADDLQNPVLDRPLPGRTGEAMQAALDRLRGSIEQAEDQRTLLEQLATHDPLTGLLNRRAAFDAMDRDALRAARAGGAVAAFFVDLDGLKELNDSHGHAAGDAAIRAAAHALGATSRRTDVVARLGGDEFLVAGPVAAGPAGVAEARALGDRLLAAIGAVTVAVGADVAVPLRASIGGAVSTSAFVDGDELVRVADEALYAAKRAGRGRIAWASSSALPGEPVEAGGIGEGAAAGGDVDGRAGEDPLHRDLELLAAQRPGH